MSLHPALIRPLALTALLFAAACGQGESDAVETAELGEGETPAPASAPAPRTVDAPAPQPDAGADRPLELDLGSEHADITLRLPEAVRAEPALYDRLVEQAEAEAGEARRIAEEDAAIAADQPDRPFNGHTMEIVWTEAFANDRVLSLLKETYVFQGGAHPNTYYDSINWRRDADAAFGIADMIEGQIGYAALSEAARNAVMQAKAERLGDDAPYSIDQVEDATAPAPANFEIFTLYPAPERPARAGGITLHYSAYTLGPYVEGAYHVAIPHTAFGGHVEAQYEAVFSGPDPEDAQTP